MNDELKHPISQAVSALLTNTCQHVHQLSITEKVTEGNVVVTVAPNVMDFRILCGSGGRQVKAMTFLVEAAGARMKKQARYRLVETFEGRSEALNLFTPNPKFDVGQLQRLVKQFCDLTFSKPPKLRCVDRPDALVVYLTPVGHDDSDSPLISALSDVFYPYGFQNGRKVKIRLGEPKTNGEAARRALLE